MIKELFNLTIVKIYLVFQLFTRLAMCFYGLWEHQIFLSNLPAILVLGFLNDLVSMSYFLPIILILIIIFRKLFARFPILYHIFYCAAYFSIILLLIFNSVAEVIFWDEFGTKFNFIAVDYLIYTNEIIGTLRESLPLIEILVTLIIIAAMITFCLRKYILSNTKDLAAKNYVIYAVLLVCLSFIAFNFYDSSKIKLSDNRYAQELSKNGPIEFFSAFYNNILDYNKLYPVISSERALEVVRSKLTQQNQKFLTENNIERLLTPKAVASHNQKKYNIILITVESLSSEFMGKFGNKQNITPYLDKIADESIFFNNLYAAGTRTVRGLEAITLSVPPTPGSSIIRRPDNKDLFNLGSIFREQGYSTYFIFGGYSYFDNLQDYFKGNGYSVVDRGNLKTSEITFANIWGVADEDILRKSLEIADQEHKKGKQFLSLIMTTSNHRPYTFPDGRIDLPSGGGRSAAVKYTDYAIGKFMEEAKKRPWFNDTIFIITADHCASSSGKTDLPIHKYHIPLMIYAPQILKPQTIDCMASQIDIAPTILGLLGIEYKSKFFGQDILNYQTNRAFISTYQLLGYMKNDHLVILAPKFKPRTYKLVGAEKHEVNNLPELVEEAISFYQIAYDFYTNGMMKNFKKE